MEIKRENGVSLHTQLEQMIRQKITSNEWPAGSLVPSENQISREYGISRMTVRGAIAKLEQEGLVQRVMGKGTFVSHPRMQGANLKFDGIVSQLQKMGYAVTTKVLSVEKKSGRKLPTMFTRATGEEFYEVQRLRYMNNSPMSLHISYIPAAMAPELEKRTDSMEVNQLFEILERDYDLKRGAVSETWSAVCAPAWVTDILQIEPAQPMLMAEAVTHSPEGKELYSEREYFRGDKISLYFEFR